MSDAAGILCDAETVADGAGGARVRSTRRSARTGIAFGRPSEAGRAVQWRQMALASEAVLTALDHYISDGGGSRGARAILDPAGEGLPMSARGPLEDVRFRRETARGSRAGRSSSAIATGSSPSPTGPIGRWTRPERPFFERDWPAWLTGAIYERQRG